MGEASRMDARLDGEHLAPGELLEFSEGRADGPTAARVREHLASGCASCAGGPQFLCGRPIEMGCRRGRDAGTALR